MSAHKFFSSVNCTCCDLGGLVMVVCLCNFCFSTLNWEILWIFKIICSCQVLFCYFLYRVGRVIKTCRIQVEGRLYTIDSKEFESLVDLVSYYERNPLYHRVKLRKPVSAEVLRRNGTVSNQGSVHTCWLQNAHKGQIHLIWFKVDAECLSTALYFLIL